MSNFFQNLFGNNDKKKSGGQAQQQGGGSVGGPKNPFANVKLNMPGQKFQGSGQSLGGNAPGKLIPINLEMEGPLGLKVMRHAYCNKQVGTKYCLYCIIVCASLL